MTLTKLLAAWSCLGGRIKALQFSRDGKQLVCGDQEGVKLWDFDLSEGICSWLYTPLEVGSLAFDRDDAQIAIGDLLGSYIWILGSETGAEVGRVPGRLSPLSLLRDVCFDPNGDVLAYCDDREIRIWSLSEQREMKVLRYESERKPHITCIAFSPNGTRIASGAYDKTVRIWSVSAGEQLLCLRGHTGYIYDLEWMTNGLRVISGSADSTVRIWDVDPDSPRFRDCLKVLEVKMNCQGMQISGTRGLEQEMTWRVKGEGRKGMLLEFFADRGAVLDEEQQRIVAEARKQRKAAEESVEEIEF